MACDSGSDGSDGSDGPKGGGEPAAPYPKVPLTRRGLMLGGLSLALAACVRGGGGGKPLGTGPGVWYAVEPGDTLTSLAQRTGLTIDRIVEVNALDSPALSVGRRLWLPDVPFVAPRPSHYRPPVADPARPTQPAAPPPDGRYDVVPRTAWTDEPVGPNHVMMGRVQRITIHHTDEHGGMAGKNDIEVVRMIERFHRGPQKRWAAIGYHYLIGKDGKVYEGRPVRFQGAHCGDNANNLGISVIGDFHRNLPNARQLAVLREFVDDQRTRFSVPRSRIYGHRDIRPTICPGDRLYGWVLEYSGRR